MPLRDFKANPSREHLFGRFFLAFVVVVVLLFISTASVKAAWEMYQTFDIAAAERMVAEAELEALRAEYAQMATTLKSFSSGRGFEAAVRERFGVALPGEGEIRIVRAAGEQVAEEGVDDNPFSRLFNALFQW